MPNLWRPLAGGAALAAAISLGEFGATSFLSRSGNETMPIVIEQLLGRTGSILQAQGYVLATMLAAITILLVALVELATGDALRDETGARPMDGRRTGRALMATVDVDRVSIAFGDNRVLDDVSLSIALG